MTDQKDLEVLINEAMDFMDKVREKLLDIIQLEPDLGKVISDNAGLFVKANNFLEDLLSEIEDVGA